MNVERDQVRIVRAWLEEGVTTLPQRVLDEVLADLSDTRQRRSFLAAWRTEPMNALLRVGLAAAVLVGAAALASNFIVPRDTTPGGLSTATPSAIHSPIPSAGNYRAQNEALTEHALVFTIPDGWHDLGGWGVEKNQSFLTVWTVQRIYRNPCRWRSSEFEDLKPSMTASQIATAIANAWVGTSLAGRDRRRLPEVSGPNHVTLAGYDAYYLELTLPSTLSVGDCDRGTGGGEYRLWDRAPGDPRSISDATERNRIWVVAGPDGNFLVDAGYIANIPSGEALEFTSIIDSIRIE